MPCCPTHGSGSMQRFCGYKDLALSRFQLTIPDHLQVVARYRREGAPGAGFPRYQTQEDSRIR
jgi:hypothetical protein